MSTVADNDRRTDAEAGFASSSGREMVRVGALYRGRSVGLSNGGAIIAAFVISIMLTFNGLNNAYGPPAVGLIAAGTLAALIVSAPPAISFWRPFFPVLALLVVGIAWATAPIWWAPAGALASPLVPDLAGVQVIGIVGYACALLIGRMLARWPGLVPVAIDALLVFGAANILIGLELRNLGGASLWGITVDAASDRFTGTVSNANVAGAYAAMLAVLALARVEGHRTRRGAPSVHHIAHWVMAVLATGACAITGSRSAILCLVTAIVILAVLRLMRSRRPGRSVGGILLLALAASALLAAGLLDVVFQRLELIGTLPSGRATLWHHEIGLVTASPWFGYGLGSFPLLNARALSAPWLAQELWTVNSPHNLILQVLLAGGLGYLLAIAAASGLIAMRIFRAFRAGQPNDGRIGLVLAIAIALGCSMVDIVLDVPAMIALTLFMAGLCWSDQRKRRTSSSRERISRQRNRNGT